MVLSYVDSQLDPSIVGIVPWIANLPRLTDVFELASMG